MTDKEPDAIEVVLENMIRDLERTTVSELGVLLAERRYAQAMMDATQMANNDSARMSAIIQVFAAEVVRNVATQVSLTIATAEDRKRFQENSARAMADMVQIGVNEGEKLAVAMRKLALKHGNNKEAWASEMWDLINSSRCSLAVPEYFAEPQH